MNKKKLYRALGRELVIVNIKLWLIRIFAFIVYGKILREKDYD